MTARLLAPHDLIWLPARIVSVYADHLECLTPTVSPTLAPVEQLLMVFYHHVVAPPSNEEAARATLVLLDRLRSTSSELEGLAHEVAALIQAWGEMASRAGVDVGALARRLAAVSLR